MLRKASSSAAVVSSAKRQFPLLPLLAQSVRHSGNNNNTITGTSFRASESVFDTAEDRLKAKDRGPHGVDYADEAAKAAKNAYGVDDFDFGKEHQTEQDHVRRVPRPRWRPPNPDQPKHPQTVVAGDEEEGKLLEAELHRQKEEEEAAPKARFFKKMQTEFKGSSFGQGNEEPDKQYPSVGETFGIASEERPATLGGRYNKLMKDIDEADAAFRELHTFDKQSDSSSNAASGLSMMGAKGTEQPTGATSISGSTYESVLPDHLHGTPTPEKRPSAFDEQPEGDNPYDIYRGDAGAHHVRSGDGSAIPGAEKEQDGMIYYGNKQKRRYSEKNSPAGRLKKALKMQGTVSPLRTILNKGMESQAYARPIAFSPTGFAKKGPLPKRLLSDFDWGDRNSAFHVARLYPFGEPLVVGIMFGVGYWFYHHQMSNKWIHWYDEYFGLDVQRTPCAESMMIMFITYACVKMLLFHPASLGVIMSTRLIRHWRGKPLGPP